MVAHGKAFKNKIMPFEPLPQIQEESAMNSKRSLSPGRESAQKFPNLSPNPSPHNGTLQPNANVVKLPPLAPAPNYGAGRKDTLQVNNEILSVQDLGESDTERQWITKARDVIGGEQVDSEDDASMLHTLHEDNHKNSNATNPQSPHAIHSPSQSPRPRANPRTSNSPHYGEETSQRSDRPSRHQKSPTPRDSDPVGHQKRFLPLNGGMSAEMGESPGSSRQQTSSKEVSQKSGSSGRGSSRSATKRFLGEHARYTKRQDSASSRNSVNVTVGQNNMAYVNDNDNDSLASSQNQMINRRPGSALPSKLVKVGLSSTPRSEQNGNSGNSALPAISPAVTRRTLPPLLPSASASPRKPNSSSNTASPRALAAAYSARSNEQPSISVTVASAGKNGGRINDNFDNDNDDVFVPEPKLSFGTHLNDGKRLSGSERSTARDASDRGRTGLALRTLVDI